MPSRPDDAGTAPFVIAGDVHSVRQALLALTATAPLCGLSQSDRGTAELVLGEVLNNIVEHAYAHGAGPIELWLETCPGGLSCRITDRGLAMREGRAPEGRLPTGLDGPLSDLPEGGFGWFLIRSLTRDLAYERRDGRNHLRFVLPGDAENRSN